MLTASRTLQCPLCKQSVVVAPGAEASTRCSQCGIDLSALSAFAVELPAAPVRPAAPPRAPRAPFTMGRIARDLGVAFLWGCVGGVATATVLAMVLAGLMMLLGAKDPTIGLIWGADLGMLLGGFLVGTWKAIRLLELELIGGGLLGATLGALTAGAHLGVEKTFLNLPESTWIGALAVGILAGFTYGAYLGARSED